ncbi:histidine-type phosphatase [Bartonella sp. LJL80]
MTRSLFSPNAFRSTITSCAIVLSAIALPLTPASAQDSMADYKLDKVVVLMRHGVRPQTETAKLNESTGKKWPEWIVPDGNLTGHGYAGIIQQSAYMLKKWRAEGLSLSNTCPQTKDAFVWASPVQRTVATAQAVTDGMFPGCGVNVGHLALEKDDPLFQAIDLEMSQPDPKKVEIEVLTAMGGSPEEAAKKYAPDVALMRQTVCGDGPEDCKFLDEKWGFKNTKPGKYKLSGPVSVGSSIAETIRLQYSEGLPLSQVAFGHVKNADDVAKLMALHAAKYDIINNTQEIAINGGSILMREILDSLVAGTPLSPVQKYPELSAPLVVFVGHDTNISQVQTISDFRWKLGNYPADDIPPGGMLIFKRYKNLKNGRYALQLSFAARSLDQWRSLTPLSPESPILSQNYTNSICTLSDKADLCDLATYENTYRNKLADKADSVVLFK